MLTVVLGLSGALIYGASDFFGGLAARRTSVLRVTFVAFIAALATAGAALPFSGSVWSTSAVVYGLIAGVAGAGALFLLYACLSIGPMSILSPLTALVSAVVPVGVGLVSGETLGALGWVAIVIALIAVALVGLQPGAASARPSAKALVMAVGSGLLIGSYLILLHETPSESGIIPIFADIVSGTVVTALVMLALALFRPGTGVRPPFRVGLWLGIWCGITQAVANILILLGLHLGNLTVLAVLNALYPAGTIVLAGIVLRERITRPQSLGLALAILAAAMLAVR